MRISLKYIVVPGIPLAVLMVVFCLGLWMSSFMSQLPTTLPTHYTPLVDVLHALFSPSPFFSNLVGIIFTLLNAFLLAHLNNQHTIIRTRTFLPLFIFLLLMSVWNETHVVNGSHLALTLFILALFNFFNMPKNRQGSEQAFMGSFFIGLASLLIHPLLLLIPMCWFGLMIFQSFSLRTFLASLLGALVPWFLIICVQYLLHTPIDFVQLIQSNFNFDFSLLTLSIPRIIYTVALSVILIMSILGTYSISNSDAIQTRNKLNFLLLMLISILIISVVCRNQVTSFLPIIALIYAILASHPLTLKQNNFYGILFIVFFFLNIAFVISKYFIS